MNLELQTTGETGYIKYLAFLYFLPPFFFLGTYFSLSRSLWLALLCGCVLTLPFLFFMSRIFLRPSLPWVFRALSAIFSLIIGGATLYGFSHFVHSCVLTTTYILVFPLILLLFSFLLSAQGLLPLEKFCRMSGPVLLLLFCLSILSAAFKIDPFFMPRSFSDFLPLSGGDSQRDFLFITLLSWLIFTVQGFILFILFSNTKKTSPILKEMVKGLFLGIVLLSAACLVTILTLGPNVFESLTYPLYYPPGLTRRAEYLERTEGLILTLFLFSCFLQTALFLRSVRQLFPFRT